MSSDRTVSVDVIRFCHRLTVEGKCHHERDGGIEPERTEEVDGAKSGGDGQDDWWGGKWGVGSFSASGKATSNGV